MNYLSAIEDFRQARHRATLKEILSRFRRDQPRLLSYDEVRQSLRAQSTRESGLKEIPLDAIIGSVNRYTDFTRDFLPKENIQPERWARVDMAMTQEAGVPPIEVYQIGEAYFVRDGNHRVSVARQIGAKTIQAYVTEVQTPVPFTPDTRSEDLILKAEYAQFLERTHLKEIRPDAEIILTSPGQYPVIEEHIAVHRYYMGLDQKRDVSYTEAVAHWYDTVYQPIAQMILEKGILKDFPGRTEADLYLWLADHRAELEEELGIQIKPSDAAENLAEQFSSRPNKVAARLGSKLLRAILPDSLEGGPPTGQWRKEKLEQPAENSPDEEHLFTKILVPISGRDSGWNAVDEGILIAGHENGHLFGLHVLPPVLTEDSPEAQELQTEFNRRCQAASVKSTFVFGTGEVTSNILERSTWVDLVIETLDYPPSTQPFGPLNHGFRALVQRSPRPIMAVKSKVTPLKRALLAFDGSPKAREALFVATYLCGQWQSSLLVVSVLENGHVGAEVLVEARQYLEEHNLEATYIQREGPADQAILQTALENDIDLLLMGGYGRGPIMDVVLGSTVNRILNELEIPVLICR